MVGWALLLLGVGIRINNAFLFEAWRGFDAVENIEYLRLLQTSWALPDPETVWSASHPPLFYYLAAALWRGLRLASLDRWLLPVLPLAISALGIAAIAVAVALVRRIDPDNHRRQVLAAGLLLFLPVHIYISPMIGEELLVTLLVSLVLALAAWPLSTPGARPDTRSMAGAAAIGVLCGLAFLTKLSGALVFGAVAILWAAEGARSRDWRSAITKLALAGSIAIAVGGWFYVHNLMAHGYLYPQDLAIHSKMFELPPGERGVMDYVRIPVATLTDPQLIQPDLLRSVWGGTYATLWFDGHRHFLGQSIALTRIGTLLLTLALLPTLAFGVGLWRGARRALAEPVGVDTLLLAMVAITLLGYVAFTYGNPWYVTVKGSYLLGLSVPFALYTSEVLADWIQGPRGRSVFVTSVLIGLAVAIVATFWIGAIFVKLDGPGLDWRALGV
jgi:hypothetical protein